ncbi:MAG: integrase [Legionellales bacterium]|nr:integrase [Legionellales bacterium]
MRKYSLRQKANRYLKTDNRGSIRDKKHRAFVIHKMINDLFVVGTVPSSWSVLKTDHIQQLVQHWQKQKIQSATIMRYMTVIRTFLNNIECPLEGIDNQNLHLSRQYKAPKRIHIQHDIWQTMTDPCAYLIMALQTQFGLTFSEATLLIPDIHVKEHALWITREIAFNSEDRMIPHRLDEQKSILRDLHIHTQGSKNLLQLYGNDGIRYHWHRTLDEHKLPINKSYRHLYAQQMKKHLSTTIGHYQLSWLIRDEMGIKSRNTLWRYFHE